MIGTKGPEEATWEEALVPFEEGLKVAMPEPLFTKLEVLLDEEEPEKETEPEKKTEKEMEGDEMDIVTFEEFMKLDLRVGKVLSVEDHPDADKLLVLQVDLGEDEPRTLVAGLKKYYSKEQMEGKNIIVVSNLKPAKIFGQMSYGMLLAAEIGDQCALLTTDKPIENGAKIT